LFTQGTTVTIAKVEVKFYLKRRNFRYRNDIESSLMGSTTSASSWLLRQQKWRNSRELASQGKPSAA
jgi:hypothetical protein